MRRVIAPVRVQALLSALAIAVAARAAYDLGALLRRDPQTPEPNEAIATSAPPLWIDWIAQGVELAVLYALSMGAVVAYLGLRAFARERLSRVELDEVAARERLRALRAQLNPHFLFNTLNSIVSLTQLHSESARQLIQQLTHLLRQTLHASEHELHEIENELEYIRAYLQIQQIRQPLQISYRLSTDRGCMKVQLPTVLLLPLVENAVTHGLQTSRRVHIEVDASRVADGVLLTVRNTYEPPPAPTARVGAGLGLRNVRERLLLLYGAHAGLTTTAATPGWFEARIHLPFMDPTACER